ncbi:FHA domain-containing protein [Gymnodinialimonas ulvae]|uniref:FHA domain-containing protein n=1 Tax=Gymnodinialimonas ulvae TaxID=3126504 RepID=UPI00309FAD86
MAKKPILTDDELDGGLTPGDPVPPPLPGTPPDRPGSATRMITDPETAPPPPPTQAAPQQGRDASGHARPKTRIHGYGGEAAPSAPDPAAAPASVAPAVPVVGWLVVTAGPGRGASVPLHQGMSGIGRDPVNSAQVDFGDDTISREAHAYVTYDDEARLFYLSHGGKTNLVRLNGTPVLTVEMLAHGDTIRIGATSLRFVALCGPDFDWSDA